MNIDTIEHELFPDCTFHQVEQGTDEWHDLRRGKITASELGQWIDPAKKDKRSKDAREKMICKLLAQSINAYEPPFFENEWMKRGKEMEPEARSSYEKWTGNEITEVGFATMNGSGGIFVGCSPDGVIFADGGLLEMKIPLPATHIGYLRSGEFPESSYGMQVRMQMAVTGASYVDFWSWNPGLPPFLSRVERDDSVEKLAEHLGVFAKELRGAAAEQASAYDQYLAELESK